MPDCYVTINGIEFEVCELSIEHEQDVVDHRGGGVDPGVIRIEAEHAMTAAEASDVFDALIPLFDNA